MRCNLKFRKRCGQSFYSNSLQYEPSKDSGSVFKNHFILNTITYVEVDSLPSGIQKASLHWLDECEE